ncbi:MAG: lipase chaperone, partial [Burkholderiaceae bacterium]
AAARGLARLDREDRDWQSRLADYAQARTRLSPQELQQFREARFTVQEQMRLEAALALRGANPP